jgi:hypothetical protein
VVGGKEVVIEGAFGGFVEFFGVEGLVGGCGIAFWWIREQWGQIYLSSKNEQTNLSLSTVSEAC